MLTRLKRYLVVTFLLVAGAALAVISSREILQKRSLAREGVFTTGRVLERSTSYRYKQGTQYHLTVEFTPTNFATLIKKFNVSAAVYQQSSASGTVQVRYLAAHPEVCAAGDEVIIDYRSALIALGMLATGLYLLWFFRHARAKIATLCVDEHHMATVNALDYRHLDYAFYESARQTLEAQGYRFLADREDLTFRRDQGLQIAIRCLISHDGTTVAGVYHLRRGWFYRALGAKDARVVDLESRFTNGDWLITSNAHAAGALSQPPGINALFLPESTSVAHVADAHGQRLVKYLQDHPDAQPCRIQTLEDVDRLAADLQRRKAEHRRSTGLTKAELQRIAGTPPSAALDLVHNGIEAGLKTPPKDPAKTQAA